MVATRRKTVAADTTASPNGRNSALAGAGEAATPAAATPSEDGYEKQREERIRENMERMQKLGILDLSHQLKKPLPSPRTGGGGLRTPLDPAKSLLLAPSRRSSRLKHVAPVSYAPPVEEEELARRKKKGMMIRVVEGEREEIYTEEHEKLLGFCKTGWTLFVDGCGADGKRIYDSIKGKTCHQCRQKTLGHRTHCCKCNMVQGQFCGDCLFMRYGENVLEAKNDPNWICPVCRGICNCSLCRLKRGWAPTGALYKKVLSLGFKSVAHYLIQTRRRQTNSEIQNPCQASSKKSLTFTDAEEDSSSLVKPVNIIISPAEDNNKEDDKSNDKGSPYPGSKHDDPPPTTVDKEVAAEKKQNSGRKSRKKEGEPAAASIVSSPDSIASRLRSARNKPPAVCSEESSAAELNNTTNTRKGRKKKEDGPTAAAATAPAVITSTSTSPSDSIASRLRKRRLA